MTDTAPKSNGSDLEVKDQVPTVMDQVVDDLKQTNYYKVGGRNKIQKGMVLNPKGRPKGSRQKLATDFVDALYEDFKEHGMEAIQLCRISDPVQYVKVIATILPKEIHFKDDRAGQMTDDLLSAFIDILDSRAQGETGEAGRLIDARAEPSSAQPADGSAEADRLHPVDVRALPPR